ncbi:hypothetical protein ACVXZY_13050 [Staphylococcus aureus]
MVLLELIKGNAKTNKLMPETGNLKGKGNAKLQLKKSMILITEEQQAAKDKVDQAEVMANADIDMLQQIQM